jgi:hypothetical protein
MSRPVTSQYKSSFKLARAFDGLFTTVAFLPAAPFDDCAGSEWALDAASFACSALISLCDLVFASFNVLISSDDELFSVFKRSVSVWLVAS